MSAIKDRIAALRKRRDQHRRELDEARTRFEECDANIRLLEGELVDDTASSERKPRRGDLKDIVLSLLDEASESGLTSAGCVHWAREKRGVDLHPGSVSSLLSRLKADEVVFFDGERYRMKRFAGPRSASGWGAQ